MPLMKPEVQKVLREAGLMKDQRESEAPLTERLNAAGLGLDEVLENLSTIINGTGNEAIKLRALETTLKAHGALKETAPSVPSFTIIIQPSLESSSASASVKSSNLPEGLNPILLPRQLLKSLDSKEKEPN